MLCLSKTLGILVVGYNFREGIRLKMESVGGWGGSTPRLRMRTSFCKGSKSWTFKKEANGGYYIGVGWRSAWASEDFVLVQLAEQIATSCDQADRQGTWSPITT